MHPTIVVSFLGQQLRPRLIQSSRSRFSVSHLFSLKIRLHISVEHLVPRMPKAVQGNDCLYEIECAEIGVSSRHTEGVCMRS